MELVFPDCWIQSNGATYQLRQVNKSYPLKAVQCALLACLAWLSWVCCSEAFSVPRQLSSGACFCRTVTTVLIHTNSTVLMHMSSRYALALYVSGLAPAAGLESGTSWALAWQLSPSN